MLPPASPRPPSVSQKEEKGSRKKDVYADVIQMSNEQIKCYLGIAFSSQYISSGKITHSGT